LIWWGSVNGDWTETDSDGKQKFTRKSLDELGATIEEAKLK